MWTKMKHFPHSLSGIHNGGKTLVKVIVWAKGANGLPDYNGEAFKAIYLLHEER